MKFKKGDKVIHKTNKKCEFIIEDILEDAYLFEGEGLHSSDYVDEFYEVK